MWQHTEGLNPKDYLEMELFKKAVDVATVCLDDQKYTSNILDTYTLLLNAWNARKENEKCQY